jgi:hypothetical protein
LFDSGSKAVKTGFASVSIVSDGDKKLKFRYENTGKGENMRQITNLNHVSFLLPAGPNLIRTII